jgi:hypothetical protein
MRTSIVVLSLLFTSCASLGGTRHEATRGVVVAHSTLAALQDGEMALVCERAGAPQAPACVPADLHRKISKLLAEAFEYDKQVAELVRDLPEGQPTPVQVLVLIGKVSGIVTSILQDLPRSPQQAQLAITLGAKP